MSLTWPERRTLNQIERALRRSDPELAATLSMFGQLNPNEAMPGGAGLFPWPWPLTWLRRSVHAQAARLVPVLLGTVALGLVITFFAVCGHSGRSLTFPDRGCEIGPGTCPTSATQARAATQAGSPGRAGRPG